MKKFLALATAAMLALSAMSATTFASDDEGVKVVVNGEEIDFTGDQAPVIQSGRTLVPFRAVFEKMGAEVSWDSSGRTGEAYYGDFYVGVKIDSKTVSLGDGSDIESDVPAQIINGRTMVPLRVLSESIGATVDWDSATKTVTVTTADIAGETPEKVSYVEKTATVTGKTSKVTYTYPVVTDVYAAAELLNGNIKSDAEETAKAVADENAIGGDITIALEVKDNGSGLLSLMYLIDGEAVNWAHYAISNGAKMSDEGYGEATNGGTRQPDDERYSIEDYDINAQAADGNTYIDAIAYYPQFVYDDDVEDTNPVAAFNAELAANAKKNVDAFIAKYKPTALTLYTKDNDKGNVFAYFQDCEVTIGDDNIATVTTTISEQTYDEPTDTISVDERNEVTRVNILTGEIVE